VINAQGRFQAFVNGAVCLLALSAGPLLYGQATGSISGTVTDVSGSAAPGAKVTV